MVIVMINPEQLEPTSREKLALLTSKINNQTFSQPVIEIVESMASACKIPIDYQILASEPLNRVKERFIKANKKFGEKSTRNHPTRFQQCVTKMSTVYTFQLHIANSTITVTILTDKSDDIVITQLIIALDMFCRCFPYDYDGLKIDIVLDHTNRDLMSRNQTYRSPDTFRNLYLESAAFNVSGYTIRSNRYILLTKSEEIIKLMFHELVHYIGLDQALKPVATEEYGWAIDAPQLKLYEAYAEMISVVLASAFTAIMMNPSQRVEVFTQILRTEIAYGYYLTSQILRFYNYDADNYKLFFQGKGTKHDCPIYIWEYVIIRSIMMSNLNEIANATSDWLVTDASRIEPLMKPTDAYIEKIGEFIRTMPRIQSVSYLAIELKH